MTPQGIGTYNIADNRTKVAENMYIHSDDDDAPKGFFTTIE